MNPRVPDNKTGFYMSQLDLSQGPVPVSVVVLYVLPIMFHDVVQSL